MEQVHRARLPSHSVAEALPDGLSAGPGQLTLPAAKQGKSTCTFRFLPEHASKTNAPSVTHNDHGPDHSLSHGLVDGVNDIQPHHRCVRYAHLHSGTAAAHMMYVCSTVPIFQRVPSAQPVWSVFSHAAINLASQPGPKGVKLSL